jgi:putative membrane protein
MRIALLISASLLATACGGREAENERADAGTAIAQPDAGGAFAARAPSAPDFAQMAAMSDMYEIQAANIALKKARTEPTREFANMMIADHTKSSQAMKEAIQASGQSLSMPTQLGAEQQSQIDTLNRLSGQEFETEYMNQQRAAHRKTLDLLKSYAGGGDVAELRQFAQATIPTVQKHHEWLEANAPSSSPMRDVPQASGGTPGATAGATPAQ